MSAEPENPYQEPATKHAADPTRSRDSLTFGQILFMLVSTVVVAGVSFFSSCYGTQTLASWKELRPVFNAGGLLVTLGFLLILPIVISIAVAIIYFRVASARLERRARERGKHDSSSASV